MNKKQLINNIASLADKWQGLTIEKQEDKVFEEYNELLEAKESGNIEEIKKELADVVITMVVLTKLESIFTTRKWVEIINHIQNDSPTEGCFTSSVFSYLFQKLDKTATQYGLNVWECLEYKYNIVANRKGEVVDGTFVKSGE